MFKIRFGKLTSFGHWKVMSTITVTFLRRLLSAGQCIAQNDKPSTLDQKDTGRPHCSKVTTHGNQTCQLFFTLSARKKAVNN